MLDRAIYGFSPYAVPAAATAVLMLVFGASVLRRQVSRVSLAFCGIVAVVFVWQVAFTLLYSTRNAAVALMWARAAYWGVPLIAPAIYHFTVEMLRIYQKRRGPTIVAWVIGGVFSLMATSSGLLVTHVQHYWFGYYPRYSPATAVPFLLFFFGYLVAALVEFIRAFPGSRGVERKRIGLLLVAFAVAYVGCVDYLPKFGIAVYPFGYLPILGFCGIAAYAFRRYDLAAITPSLAANEIIGTMGDALFVLDIESRIRFANRAAETLLGYHSGDLVGRNIDAFFNDEIGDLSSTNVSSDAVANKERVFIARNGERVDVLLSISPVLQHGETSGAVLIARDIRAAKRTERERQAAEEAVRESEVRYRLLFERNAAGVCVASRNGQIEDCNETFASMLGYSRRELIGGRLNEVYWRPADREELERMLRDVNTLNSVETELRRKDGTRLWIVQNLTMDGVRIHMTMVDISDRKRAEEQIEFHAYHDVLTALPNRKLFMDRLIQNLTHCRRSNKSLAVMFIDLDRFKSINDTLGHTAGDEVLLEMARRLASCVRSDDTVARLGGDEFSIVLAELRMPEDAGRVAEKIITAVSRPVMIGGVPIEISASIGIALYPNDGADAESLLRNADGAMYRAKEAGRNTYSLCTDEMKQRAIERLTLETRLRKAIMEEHLVLHYQPQVSLDRLRVIGVEALVRWNDPDHGLVYPASFIPLAEESRLILPIGDWVLRTACEQMRTWREQGVDVPHVAVNLSARQFQQHDLIERVSRVLSDTGLDPKSLEIEITETTAMANAEATMDVLHGLRELGVSIAIDDFGTGYSSLNYLKRFPITTVKIDRAFVRDLATSEGDAAIVNAVIGIARSLRVRVIAEGVEDEEQLTFLRRNGCDAAQGYYFSRPVNSDTIAELLIDHAPVAVRHPRIVV